MHRALLPSKCPACGEDVPRAAAHRCPICLNPFSRVSSPATRLRPMRPSRGGGAGASRGAERPLPGIGRGGTGDD